MIGKRRNGNKSPMNFLKIPKTIFNLIKLEEQPNVNSPRLKVWIVARSKEWEKNRN